MNRQFWSKKNVLVTGHTGFKGGWLCTWLINMGAHVTGIALPPENGSSFFKTCALDSKMKSVIGDIRDKSLMKRTLKTTNPDVIFHLAAQSLVLKSYDDPVETFETNVIGTVNLLESARNLKRVKSIVVVTSDKCYENKEWSWGYRENESMGGSDPYSASKGCTELATHAYRKSFFKEKGSAGVVTARAGNVIGGGDWATNRLIPDAVRAFSKGKPLLVRNPSSVRPWQHVLEPLTGYLLLGEKVYREKEKWEGSWNFGPSYEDSLPVAMLADHLVKSWGGGRWFHEKQSNALHEAQVLRLDSSKARQLLEWKPRLAVREAVDMTMQWYKKAIDKKNSLEMFDFSCKQIETYERIK